MLSTRCFIIVGVVMAALASAAGVPARAGDPMAGQRVFRSQCSICHSAQPGRNVIGPTLFGVIGGHSGRISGFHYSSANLRSGVTWDPMTLDRYLASPQQVVPGTLMSYPGLKNPQKRADSIAYLETLR
jgi:cytochrome c